MNSEKIKLLLGGAAGGAIVLAIIGFAWGGWVTGGTAREMAVVAAGDAVAERLAPICVAQYTQDPEKDQKLKTMMEKSTWERHNYVAEQGWATMPGEKDSDSKTSSECAELLAKLGQ